MLLTCPPICANIAETAKAKEGHAVAKWRLEYRKPSVGAQGRTVVADELKWDSDFVQFISTQKIPEHIVFLIEKSAVITVERQSED
jgi:hypothetical protein